MAMLEGEAELTLELLNQATIAWVEKEYHHKRHSEIDTTPLARYLQSSNVGRDCPETTVLHQAFTAQVHRKQRKSDGTVSIASRRFEVPAQYRHLQSLTLRYTRWDLSRVLLVDTHTNHCIATLYPQDKSANAQGLRRQFSDVKSTENTTETSTESGIAPLLKHLMAEYAATGLPPAYLPKGDTK